MKTWFDFYTQKWVSEKPQRYWTGLTCIETKEKISVSIHMLWLMVKYQK